MPLIRLRHVNKFTDRHGRVRLYFRPPGCKAVPLPGPIGSSEFMEAYNAAISEPLPKVGIPLKSGTVAALAISYLNSATFKEAPRDATNGARHHRSTRGAIWRR